MSVRRAAAAEEAAPPVISVVVATYARPELLPGLVAALAAQRGIESHELIVVDDCSADETPAVLARLERSAGIPLRAIRAPRNDGPAAARNLGWRAARAPLVAFTDDDCIPEPRWLAGLAAALAEAEIAQGRTIVDRGRLATGPFARTLAITEKSWKFETCNIAYRRSLLARLGGFDERFRAPFGEDCDLGWRAVDGGARLAWAPDAVVAHRVHTSGNKFRDWVRLLKDTRRQAFAALMVKKHPGMRRHLFLRLFYARRHAAAVVAVAGLAIAAIGWSSPWWVAGGLALVLPWIHARTMVDRIPGRRRWYWAVLPMTLVVDLAEITAIAVGAIRYRTPLL